MLYLREAYFFLGFFAAAVFLGAGFFAPPFLHAIGVLLSYTLMRYISVTLPVESVTISRVSLS